MDEEAERHFTGWWEQHGSRLFPDIEPAKACAIYVAGFGRGSEETVRFQQAEPASAVPQ